MNRATSVWPLVAAACLVFTPAVGAFDVAQPDPTATEAQRELFAARYKEAVTLYRRLVERQPSEGQSWYGLVRAELGFHHSHEAYAAAEEALTRAPQSAGAQTAAGLAMYRRADLAKAEACYRAALKLDPDYPGALSGLASIYSAVSMFRSARDLRLKAYRLSPKDPDLMVSYANTLKGQDHIAALEAAVALLDPASDEARHLRIHIANDRALGDRKLRRLISPYETSRMKLLRIMDGPSRLIGVGISLRLNQKQTVRLLLDTGASGIALSPRMAEKAGLQVISGEASEAKGIGDQKAPASVAYLASEIRTGSIVFADYPISVFKSAQTSDYDGLIGADVFEPFLVKIDFVQLTISLEARPDGSAEKPDEPVDWKDPLPPGFHKIYRFGDHLAVPTLINEKRAALFLIDSGSMLNLIDTEIAGEVTKVSADSGMRVKGIQGKVDRTSRAGRISLLFAGFRQDNPELLAISLEKMGDSMGVRLAGILGMPVLWNLAATIDYCRGAVRLEYNKP